VRGSMPTPRLRRKISTRTGEARAQPRRPLPVNTPPEGRSRKVSTGPLVRLSEEHAKPSQGAPGTPLACPCLGDRLSAKDWTPQCTWSSLDLHRLLGQPRARAVCVSGVDGRPRRTPRFGVGRQGFGIHRCLPRLRPGPIACDRWTHVPCGRSEDDRVRACPFHPLAESSAAIRPGQSWRVQLRPGSAPNSRAGHVGGQAWPGRASSGP